MGFRTCWDERIHTDPYSADTDGDGLSDGREVGQFVESSTLAGGCYLLNSNPTKVDSDGDGLSDYEETAGWRIYYSETPDQSKQFLQSLYRNESTPGDELTPLHVTSNPLRPDTDGDGVSDARELRLGTHPADTDTDSDGVSDAAELSLDADPTLHDFRGPATRVSGHTTTFEGDNLDEPIAHYLTYSLSDPSGVDTARIIRRGEEESVSRWTDTTSVNGYRDRYNTSYLEEAVGLLSGVRTKVVTTDRHGNRHVTAAYSRPNFAGRMASHLSQDVHSPRAAEDLGQLSGFASGLGGTVSTIETLRDHPEEFIEAIDTFLRILQDLGLLKEFIERLPETIQRQQTLQNPYNPNDPTEEELYERFQRGWYAGYVLYFVVEAWIGTKGASALKNSERAADLVRKIDRTGHLRKGYGSYVRAKGAATQPAKKAGVKLAGTVKASAGYSLRSSRRMFAGVRTVGKEVVLSRQLRDIDGSMVQALSARQQVRLRVVLLRKPGANSLFRKFDSDDTDAVRKILQSRAQAKAAVDLHEMGVSARRISELAERDIDLVKHREGLRIYRSSPKVVGGDEGDIAEVIAHERIKEEFSHTDWELVPRDQQKGIEIHYENGQNAEIDHVLVNENGDVVKVFESKVPADEADRAEGQLRGHIIDIKTSREIKRTSPSGFTDAKFQNIDALEDSDDIITVGPHRNGYDLSLPFSEEQLKELYKTTRTMEAA